MIPTPVNAHTIDKAGQALGLFLIRYARQVERSLGFGYVPAQDAPDSLEDVTRELAACTRERRPFRVFSGNSEGTIYGTAEANYAFRFWHDVVHAQRQTGFTLSGELRTASIQAQAVRQQFGADSLEFAVFTADTSGQSLYAHLTGGRFVADQSAFVRHLVLATQGGRGLVDSVWQWIAQEAMAA